MWFKLTWCGRQNRELLQDAQLHAKNISTTRMRLKSYLQMRFYYNYKNGGYYVILVNKLYNHIKEIYIMIFLKLQPKDGKLRDVAMDKVSF